MVTMMTQHVTDVGVLVVGWLLLIACQVIRYRNWRKRQREAITKCSDQADESLGTVL